MKRFLQIFWRIIRNVNTTLHILPGNIPKITYSKIENGAIRCTSPGNGKLVFRAITTLQHEIYNDDCLIEYMWMFSAVLPG